MATLQSRTISSSYTELLKTTGSGGITGTLDTVQDGDATDSALQLSNAGIKSTGTLEVAGDSTLTGAVSIGGVTLSATGTELNFCDGVTSSIQTQLDLKAPLDSPTLTSPVFNTGVSGSAVLDSDTRSGASSTTLATSESIKAYVDAEVGAHDADDLEGTTLATNVVTSSLTTLGTVGTGEWAATDVAIAHGGTGASTAQAGIDALTQSSGATTDHVLTRNSSGNAVWQISPTGPTGATGAAGADGATWLTGTSDPAEGTGSVGDFYINSTSDEWFEKTDASTWTSRGDFTGATGATGAAGADGADGQAGNGGNGLASSITGASVTRAGGGGGGVQGGTTNDKGAGGSGGGGAGGDAGAVGVSGTANTGSGGGGSGWKFYLAGSGGSGVVILRMLTADYSGTTTGSPTVDSSTVAGTTILTFNASGSYTV